MEQPSYLTEIAGQAATGGKAQYPTTLTQREALELVRDCSSQEWQQADGKRMGATDNQGRRMWFITEDVMQAVRDVLDRPPTKRVTADQIARAGERAMKQLRAIERAKG